MIAEISLHRAFVAALAIGALACGTTSLPPYPMRSASEYPTAQTQGSLVVAIEPLLDPDASARAFGTELLDDEKVLAVLVVVENRSDRASFFVPSDGIETTITPAAPPVPGAHEVGKQIAVGAAATAVGIGAFFFAPLLAVSLPMTMAMAHDANERSTGRHALIRSTWYGHTVSPGQREAGFVYVPLARIPADATTFVLRIAAYDVFTDAESSFEFEVDVPPRADD